MTAFFDTNILVYAQEAGRRGDIARGVLARGGLVSVQVLNELAVVLRRKAGRDWDEIAAVIADVLAVTGEPMPLTRALHEAGLALARDHRLSFWDALIVAAALEAGATRLLSEDLQHGRRFGALEIRNPFREGENESPG